MKIYQYITLTLLIGIIYLIISYKVGNKNELTGSRIIKFKGIVAMNGKPLKSEIRWVLVNKATQQTMVIESKDIENATAEINKFDNNQKNEWLLSAESKKYFAVTHFNINKLKLNTFEVVMVKKEKKNKIIAPQKVGSSETIKIKWQLLSYIDAKINIESRGEEPNFYSRKSIYTLEHKENKEADLRAPSSPGEYIIRLYDTKNSGSVLLEEPLTVIKSKIKIIVAKEVYAGTRFTIRWNAPKGVEGKINFKKESEKVEYYSKYFVKTKGWSARDMVAPSEEGDYVFRWYDYFSRKYLFERAIKIKKANIEVMTEGKATVNKKFIVRWKAPKGSVGRIYLRNNSDKKNYTSFSIEGKNEHQLIMPDKVGIYSLVWVGGIDKQEMVVQKLTVSSD